MHIFIGDTTEVHTGLKNCDPPVMLTVASEKSQCLKNTACVHVEEILLVIWHSRREASVCIVAK